MKFIIGKFLLNLVFLCSLMITLTKADKIKIHVVPHTHDDAGWLWTFDEYYYGKGDPNQCVKNILDNMVLSLSENKDRTFIYVEMSFFTKWYKNQKDETKNKVKKFILEGRFEFINGGYVMHDEATTYYQHFIDQMRLGLLFLKNEFNYVPKIGWFIDPFGHSAANAYVLSKMGFEKIAIVRIENKEKDIRKKEKSLEFYYIPFNNYDKARIFTHITYDHYCPPSAFNPLRRDEEKNYSQDEIKIIANQSYNELKTWNSGYRHNHVLMMFGCDFTFNKKNVNFENIEQFMNYFNNNLDMEMVYSTPSKYFEQIFSKVDTWPEYKTKDFFPYAEYPYSYWTGFFTSRPYLKGTIRETANYLVSSTHLFLEMLLRKKMNHYSLKNENQLLQNIFELREKLAICQHHDAVTGTAKEKVSQDYINMLKDSSSKVKESIKSLFGDYISNSKFINNNFLTFDRKKDQQLFYLKKIPHSPSISDSLKDQVRFLIYNPGLSGKYHLSFDYEDSNLTLFFDTGNDELILIPTNIVCMDEKSDYPLKLKCKVNFYLEFDNKNLFYKIVLEKQGTPQAIKNEKLQNITIDNEYLLFAYNSDSQNKNEFVYMLKKDKIEYQFKISHGYYDSYDGYNSKIRPMGSNPSGAYVLSTSKEDPETYKVIPEKSFISRGNNFLQITLAFEQSFMHIKLIDNKFLEIETVWGKISQTNTGKEYVLLVSSDIQNNVKFTSGISRPEVWTDSNGMKLMRRYKDYREGYDYYVTEKVASNFYPVNSMISMRDRNQILFDSNEYGSISNNDRMISLLNDRPQSMGVMKEGEFIAILNRYSTRDDWKGLEEALFETSSANYLIIKHFLVFGANFDKKYFKNIFHNQPSYYFNKNVNLPEDGSVINKIIECSPNVDVNYHILNENEFFVQLYNYNDFYFGDDRKNLQEECTFKEISLPYKIKEYNLGGVIEIDQDNLKFETKRNIQKIVKLSPQELKLYKIFI